MTYIWDLDGTLIDSYPGILKSLLNVLDYFDISLDENYVYNFILQKSVLDFLNEISNKYSLDFNTIINKYRENEIKIEKDVYLIDGAKETLKGIKERGDLNFLYTHKGSATMDILKELDICDYFTLIITSENNFKRKPDPEGINYIINKYNLNPNDVYYVGDRPLDVLCAKNANVKSILYKKEGSPINIDATIVIKNLTDILKK